MPGPFTPLAYRDSDDGELRPAPQFIWAPAASRHVQASQTGGQQPVGPAAAPPPASEERLQLAAAVARKCLDLGLPRPPIPRREAAPVQQPLPEQQQAYKQLAAATTQLQRQSGQLVGALESQAVQLAAQQRLLQDLVQGMLFVAAKTSAAPPAPAAVLVQQPLQPVVHLGPAIPAAAAAVPRQQPTSLGILQTAGTQQQQQQQQQAAEPALLQDLANILASHAQRAQQAQPGAEVPRPYMPQTAPPHADHDQGVVWEGASGRAAAVHPLGMSSSRQMRAGSPATPRPTRATQLRMARAPTGERPQGVQEAATASGSPQKTLGKGSTAMKPQWDDSTVLAREAAQRGRRRSDRLDDPLEQPPRRRPSGASASLAAQLLMQELAKFRLKQGGQGRKSRQAQSTPLGQANRMAAAEMPGRAMLVALGRQQQQQQQPLQVPTAPMVKCVRRLSRERPGEAAAMQTVREGPAEQQHAKTAAAGGGTGAMRGAGGHQAEHCGAAADPPAGRSNAPESQRPSSALGGSANQECESCSTAVPPDAHAAGASCSCGSSCPPAAHTALPAAQGMQASSAHAPGDQQQAAPEAAQENAAGLVRPPPVVPASHVQNNARGASYSWDVVQQQLPCSEPASQLGEDELLEVCNAAIDSLLLGEFLPCCARD